MKFFILLLISTCCLGQVPDIAKDTLQLEEVILSNDKHHKTKRIKLEGVCSYPEDMKDASEIITLVDNLPKGNLGSVTFYFNKIDAESYRQNSGQFKDADFEVVLYDTDANNMPDRPSSPEKKFIGVGKAHQGKITIDFSLFNIQTQKKMFIGLRKLSESSDAKSFLLDCLCSGQDRYITYYRRDADSPWQRRWSCAALKIEVDVIVH